MRDAIGGTVVVAIIVFFLVVVLAYMAFNVNYTKAFRMKNKIISLYKEYDGNCFKDEACRKQIKRYAKKIGYAPAKVVNCPCSDGDVNVLQYSDRTLYCACLRKITVSSDSNKDIRSDLKSRCYYHIVTKINIDIPIISNLMDLQLFSVSGDTEQFDKC